VSQKKKKKQSAISQFEEETIIVDISLRTLGSKGNVCAILSYREEDARCLLLEASSSSRNKLIEPVSLLQLNERSVYCVL
jgi:hypothetical protein